MNSGWVGDHADLWNLLGDELRTRAMTVVVSCVKGHAKQIDIDRGRTTKEDKKGNDSADALAMAGANMPSTDFRLQPGYVASSGCPPPPMGARAQKGESMVRAGRPRKGRQGGNDTVPNGKGKQQSPYGRRTPEYRRGQQ